MNDDKLKKLFADYEPEMENDAMFMARLERNLRAVEFIKEKNAVAKRNNRVAMAIACAVCFLAGGLFVSVIPNIVQWLNSQVSINVFPPLQPEQVTDIVMYCLGCVSTVVLTLASYDIALGVVSCKR